MNLARCKSCGAPIWWATTTHGRPIPIDRKPAADGNVTLERVPGGELRALVHAGQSAALLTGQMRWRSHFASCPQASQHRRRA